MKIARVVHIQHASSDVRLTYIRTRTLWFMRTDSAAVVVSYTRRYIFFFFLMIVAWRNIRKMAWLKLWVVCVRAFSIVRRHVEVQRTGIRRGVAKISVRQSHTIITELLVFLF